MSNFFSSIILAQVWSLQVLWHFGNLEILSTTFMLTTLAKSPLNLVKNFQEVGTKNLDNLMKISLSVFDKKSWLHEPISQDLSIFWTSTLRDKVIEFNKIYNFHVESFPWIILHLGEKLSWSIEIIKVKKYLEIF